MMDSFFSRMVAVVGLLCGIALLAQTPAEESVTFRSGVANVRVDAQVVQDNELVTELTAQDFVVMDEGKPQPIIYFGRESEPLSLLLVLDISGSMRNHIAQVAAVARQSLGFLRQGDRVGVMVFARNSKVRRDFTSDMAAVADEIRSAVNDDTLGSGTALNVALQESARYMDEHAGETGRRAILILTDNLGLNHKIPDEVVLKALSGANTVVNALVVGKGSKPPEQMPPGVYTNPDFTPFNVFRIAEESGGEAVRAEKAGSAFSRMIERIRTRYSLHYNKPEGAASGYRNVAVTLTPAARLRYPRAIVRARKGYQLKS